MSVRNYLKDVAVRILSTHLFMYRMKGTHQLHEIHLNLSVKITSKYVDVRILVN